jgi:hypothetical protein
VSLSEPQFFLRIWGGAAGVQPPRPSRSVPSATQDAARVVRIALWIADLFSLERAELEPGASVRSLHRPGLVGPRGAGKEAGWTG